MRQLEETIVDNSPNVTWDEIKGLEEVKRVLKETIVLPAIRPDLF